MQGSNDASRNSGNRFATRAPTGSSLLSDRHNDGRTRSDKSPTNCWRLFCASRTWGHFRVLAPQRGAQRLRAISVCDSPPGGEGSFCWSATRPNFGLTPTAPELLVVVVTELASSLDWAILHQISLGLGVADCIQPYCYQSIGRVLPMRHLPVPSTAASVEW
jgi:hypothetical protein